MPRVVTFYSYKGGVGRTLALVNVAHAMARDGLRVLMIDLDLEAPGMTHFFADRVREHKAARPSSKDALDLLLEIKHAGGKRPSKDDPFKAVSLADYVVPIELPKAWGDTDSPYFNGRLDLLPATLDPSLHPEPDRGYLERLSQLDLPGIFSTDGPGHRFGQWLRRHLDDVRFETPGDVLYTLREKVWATYDVILVDSRTGLNESSGLCVGPLCDALVICTALNEQNVVGTEYFMQRAGLFDQEKAKPYGVIVGPVPPWHASEARERIDRVMKALKITELLTQVPYHPAAALGEPVFSRIGEETGMTTIFEHAATKITRLAGLGRRSSPQTAPSEKLTVDGLARSLPEFRRIPDPLLFPLPFPTLGTLLLGHVGDRERWTALGAGIAAYRLKSHAPLARLALSAIQSGHHGDLAGELLFTRLRLVEQIPLNLAEEPWVGEILNRQPESLIHDLALAYASVLGLRGIKESAESIERRPWWFDMHGSEVVRKIQRRMKVEEGRPDPLLRYVLGATLPEGIREQLEVVLSEPDLEAIHHKEVTGRHPRRERNLYGGFPFTPTAAVMVSLTALTFGAKGINRILTWLTFCREEFGYAWRVLVDWRHLKPIARHSKFLAFMKEEDDIVERIEADIDSGRYPL